jgi:predicted RNase H-like nuclease (RuvC/YqgF family)
MKEELGKKVTPEDVSTSIEDSKEIKEEEIISIMDKKEVAELEFNKLSKHEKVSRLLGENTGLVNLKDLKIKWINRHNARGSMGDGEIVYVGDKSYGSNQIVGSGKNPNWEWHGDGTRAGLEIENGNLVIDQVPSKTTSVRKILLLDDNGRIKGEEDNIELPHTKTILCNIEDILSIDTNIDNGEYYDDGAQIFHTSFE